MTTWLDSAAPPRGYRPITPLGPPPPGEPLLAVRCGTTRRKAQRRAEGQARLILRQKDDDEKARKDARDKLDAMPGIDQDGDLISTPFSIVDNPPYSVTLDALAAAKEKKVAVDTLIGQQRAIKRSKVARFIQEHPNNTEGLPLVVKSGGTHYILDGHHRGTAALLLGQKKMPAIVMKIDSSGSPSL